MSLEAVLGALDSGNRQPLFLVVGDRVLAEPAALQLGERLAAQAGCQIEVHRRPTDLGAILADLRTFSLFSTAKVVVAVECAVLADLKAAASLLEESARELPVAAASGELTAAQRLGAARLLQVLRLYQIDPHDGAPTAVLERLPDSAFAGRRGRRPAKARLAELRGGLAELLEAALAAGLEGRAESDLVQLAEIAERGLPEGHALVLAESAVAREHPLVAALSERRALVEVARVEPGRRGDWRGLDPLVEELERQTGIGIEPQALSELARRTLQRSGERRRSPGAAADSTERFAAEYRKLAVLTSSGSIGVDLVRGVVEDRGEEDLWQVLDAVGKGSGADALRRLRRLLAAAEDPVAARLSFFAVLAEFARHLTAIGGLIGQPGIPAGERSYPRFKSRIAPRLQEDLGGGRPSPLAGIHPFRLHKAYLAASGVAPATLAKMPSRLLEAELQLKGETSRPQVALEGLVSELASLVAGESR